jgi:heme-degrading monooxygenase HmoA
MILEAAAIQVTAGEEAGFEEAMRRAVPVIAGAAGYIGHTLQRCVESPGRYLLLVRWDTLEAHTVNFRGSPAFAEWRAIIGPYFASAPVVEHYEEVLEYSGKAVSREPVSEGPVR